MGAIWLSGATPGYPATVDVLRAAGLTVVTYAGHETRSRSSGGYQILAGVVWHHTASNTTPANDVNYCINGPDAPIASCILDRDGIVHWYASGAANHAGKGGGSAEGGGEPWRTARGTVPADSGNSHALGVEMANAGDGIQAWPTPQTDSAVRMGRALADAYGFVVATDYWSHAYVPAAKGWTTRKIDPRGPSPWQPANSSSPWDMNAFRASVDAATGGPTPTPQEDNVLTIFTVDGAGAAFLGFTWQGLGQSVEWLDTQAKLDTYRRHNCPELRIGIPDCANLYLLGPVPTGDHKHAWTAADFRGVIPT